MIAGFRGKTALQWAPGCTAARTEHVSPQFCAQVQRDGHNSFDSDNRGGKLQMDHKNADCRYPFFTILFFDIGYARCFQYENFYDSYEYGRFLRDSYNSYGESDGDGGYPDKNDGQSLNLI